GGPNAHDLWRNGKEVFERGKYFPDLMVAEADQFLAKNKNTPFFLYFAINLPHYPLQPEQKWLDYYKNLKKPRNMYAAYVSTMDEKVGLLLKKLDKLGLRKNTIVIFQSDQGFSKEDRTFGGGGSAAPYRGSKESLFEGGIRIPAFISWPGHIPVNAVRNQLATNIDWFATLAEYCHLPLPNRKIDGASISKIISSSVAKSPHSDFYWQCLGSKENPQWAVREGDWKLLHNPLQSKPTDVDADKFMLIDMKTDSTETTNVADRHPDIVQRLLKKYQDWIIEVTNQ
ncbi:MAG: sulfatase, partial [Sphingobacteriaceae bacterium]